MLPVVGDAAQYLAGPRERRLGESYARVSERYAKLCETYPQSGPLHNLYAWAAAKCRRQLDAALAHARRAVELQPTNTASIDTLAEAHFQRGEFAEAIVAMARCAELEPNERRHKEQLERFRKAQENAATKGGRADKTLSGSR